MTSTIEKSLSSLSRVLDGFLQRSLPERRTNVAAYAGTLAIGLAIGAVASLLLAPRSGRDLRDSIGRAAERARDRWTTAAAAPSVAAEIEAMSTPASHTGSKDDGAAKGRARQGERTS